METRHIFISKEKLDDLNKLLTGEVENQQDGTIETFTVVFGHGVEADIKVVGVGVTEQWKKEDNATPYIDAVLFIDGCEVCTLEPSFEHLDGEYLFEFEGDQYQVIVAEGK